MKKNIDFDTFQNCFKKTRPYIWEFTYEGLRELYNHLESTEEGLGSEIDVAAICRAYSEHSEDSLVMKYSYISPSLETIINDFIDMSWIIKLPNGNYLVREFNESARND